jgi:hypothetical protein
MNISEKFIYLFIYFYCLFRDKHTVCLRDTLVHFAIYLSYGIVRCETGG